MENFKPNQYIELFNPGKNNYFPIRILEENDNGYKAIILENDKKINVYEYQLKSYGYRNIWITEKLMNQLGFEKNGLIYSRQNTIVWECLIGDLKQTEHPYYLYEFNSKHLGYVILNADEVDQFREDYNEIEFEAANHKIKEKYSFTSSINDIFTSLMEKAPNDFNYEILDKIVINKK